MKIRSIAAPLFAAIVAVSAPAYGQGKGHGGGAGGKSHGGDKGQGQERKAGKSQGAGNRGHGQLRKAETARRMPDMKLPTPKTNQGRPDVAQDKGRGRGSDKDNKLTGRANAEAKRLERASGGEVGKAFGLSRVKHSRFMRDLDFGDIAPPARVFVASPRPGERLVGKAVALAFARGVPDNALVIVPTGPRYVVRNLDGVVLLDLDEQRALNPGYWKVVTVDDRVKDGAPSFCRSGAGHPVWGRQWCVDKGFGLGSDRDFRWARTVNPNDVVFLNTGTGSLTRDVLASVLGPIVLDRLGLHALTLGYTDPLTGQWLGQGSSPRVLFVTSGGRPVAELVDTNGDNRADNMLVALRPW